jgi:hypothetical protein
MTWLLGPGLVLRWPGPGRGPQWPCVNAGPLAWPAPRTSAGRRPRLRDHPGHPDPGGDRSHRRATTADVHAPRGRGTQTTATRRRHQPNPLGFLRDGHHRTGRVRVRDHPHPHANGCGNPATDTCSRTCPVPAAPRSLPSPASPAPPPLITPCSMTQGLTRRQRPRSDTKPQTRQDPARRPRLPQRTPARNAQPKSRPG